MATATENQIINDVTLKGSEDSIVIRFLTPEGIDGPCYEIYGDGTIQVWSPKDMTAQTNLL